MKLLVPSGSKQSVFRAPKALSATPVMLVVFDGVMTFGGHATTDALIQSNPDLVRRSVRALMKGLIVVKSARADTIATLVKHGSTPDAAAASYDIFSSSLSPTAIVSDADQAFELKLRAHMLGVAEDKVPPPAQFFDFSFVKKAAAELKAEGWKPVIGN
jgi:ABC-type nitrate/sulfonate/bicarbonate transport system substrate-binding protein